MHEMAFSVPICLLVCAGFHVVSVNGRAENGEEKGICVDPAYLSYDVEYLLGTYLLNLLKKSSTNETEQIEAAENAFVPDLYNATSFLVPRLVFVLFTCDDSEDIQSAIDDGRAFVWASEYLFLYMHPAVIRLVSLLDVTLLGPSVHTLKLCFPSNCSNTTLAFSFEETILKVRESVFLRKTSAFRSRAHASLQLTFSDAWNSYLYSQTGYIINLHEAIPNFYIATYCLFMGVFFLSLFIGMIVMIAVNMEVINKLVVRDQLDINRKKSIPVLYRWSGIFSGVVCCQILLMFVCYVMASFKELSSYIFPDLSAFSVLCHIIAYVFIWFVGFCCACCLPQFLAKKYFKNKLGLLINRKGCGCGDRLVLGFVLIFCTIIFYHIVFVLIVFLYYPLLVICVLIGRLTYLTILGLCVFTSIRLYMTFGIHHVWIYCNIFIQTIIMFLYGSVLYGVGTMLGIGYTLENGVLVKYIIVALFVSVGVIIISYYVHVICCKPLFYSEKELLKVKQKKREEDCNETVLNMSELSPTVVGNSNEVAIRNPMDPASSGMIHFAGGMLLVKDGNITWIPFKQK